MIDLIKEIEKLKLDIEKHNELWASGVNCGIYQCQKLLDQYNIITAPKEIKLSEIVSRLNEINSIYYFNKSKNAIGTGEYDSLWYQNTWTGIVYFYNEKKIMKINKIDYPFKENTKWLYTLWIAGTTIIDDLEVQDEK